jgi:hypothetical protein
MCDGVGDERQRRQGFSTLACQNRPLVKFDADAFLLSPNHLTRHDDFTADYQIEPVWDAHWTRDLKQRTAVRKIAHHAVNRRLSIIEGDLCRLVDPLTLGPTVLFQKAHSINQEPSTPSILADAG